MKTLERDKALRLRIDSQLGFATIAKQLKVSKSTVSRWLKDHPLSPERILELRRSTWSRGEASRELFRQTMRKKRDQQEHAVYLVQKRKFKTLSKQSVFVAGLMLYVAEGNKQSTYTIALANTDVRLVRFFISWLQNFLDVPRSKMRAQLHLYKTMNIAEQKQYWIRELGFESDQFYKAQIRDVRPGSFSYRESFRHGTCQIYVHGYQKKIELMLSIKAFFDTHSGLRA